MIIRRRGKVRLSIFILRNVVGLIYRLGRVLKGKCARNVCEVEHLQAGTRGWVLWVAGRLFGDFICGGGSGCPKGPQYCGGEGWGASMWLM